MKMLLVRLFLSVGMLYMSYQETQAPFTTAILTLMFISNEMMAVYFVRQRKNMAFLEGQLDTILKIVKRIPMKKGVTNDEEHF